MDFEGLLTTLSGKFAEAHIRYALIGALALHAAGYHRSTGDVDLLVHADDIPAVQGILLGLGYRILHESGDVLNFASPWGLIGGVDIIKARRKYALRMLEKARPSLLGAKISIPAVVPEDLIGLKLQAMANDPARQTRDLADIEWVLSHHSHTMDMQLVEEYFGLFSMEQEFKTVLQRIRNAQP